MGKSGGRAPGIWFIVVDWCEIAFAEAHSYIPAPGATSTITSVTATSQAHFGALMTLRLELANSTTYHAEVSGVSHEVHIQLWDGVDVNVGQEQSDY